MGKRRRRELGEYQAQANAALDLIRAMERGWLDIRTRRLQRRVGSDALIDFHMMSPLLWLDLEYHYLSEIRNGGLRAALAADDERVRSVLRTLGIEVVQSR